MQRFDTAFSKRSVHPLKIYWSWEMFENVYKGEYETREDDEDYIGPRKWLPIYKITPFFILYLIVGISVVTPVYLLLDLVSFVRRPFG